MQGSAASPPGWWGKARREERGRGRNSSREPLIRRNHGSPSPAPSPPSSLHYPSLPGGGWGKARGLLSRSPRAFTMRLYGGRFLWESSNWGDVCTLGWFLSEIKDSLQNRVFVRDLQLWGKPAISDQCVLCAGFPGRPLSAVFMWGWEEERGE